jgi:hypothetical protein
MRGGLVVAAGAGGALLLAALAGVESAAERQPSADHPSPAALPRFVEHEPDLLPSMSEVDQVERLASPVFTR